MEEGYALERMTGRGEEDVRKMCRLDNAKKLRPGADPMASSYNVRSEPKVVKVWDIQASCLHARYQAGKMKIREDIDMMRRKGLVMKGVPDGKVAMHGKGGFEYDGGMMSTSYDGVDGIGMLEKDVNERYLLHSPGLTILPSILTNGFNEHYAGTNAGAVYGEGCYFAENIGKTNIYAPRDAQYYEGGDVEMRRLYEKMWGAADQHDHPGNVYYVLVCRIALGESVEINEVPYTGGHAKKGYPGVFALNDRAIQHGCYFRRELANIPGTSRPYHSLIGTAYDRWREFIIFDAGRIYPQFLVAYQRP